MLSKIADASPLAPQVPSAAAGNADDAAAAGQVSDSVTTVADALKSSTMLKVGTGYKSRNDFLVGWVDCRRLILA